MSLYPAIQSTDCKSRYLDPLFKIYSKCFYCLARKPASWCRFIGTRTLVSPGNVTFRFPPGSDPQFPSVFNKNLKSHPGATEAKLKACAAFLLPLLRDERLHLARHNIVYRKREIDVRVTCDRCSAELFTGTWLCSACGFELCSDCGHGFELTDTDCPSDCQTQHTETYLLPTTRFLQNELDAAIAGMYTLSIEESIRAQPSQPSHTNAEVPVLYSETCSLDEFQRWWSTGSPVIFKGVSDSFQGDWDPEYFAQTFRNKPVKLVNCETNVERTSTVADFFRSLFSTEDRKETMKLKDWPPRKHFSTECPELFKAFNDGAPCPDYVRSDGILNLAAHFPHNCIPPDLGPKLYIAHGTVQDECHHGSTRLHMDLTDAINIMLWAARSSDGTPGSATWHIFPKQSSAILSDFLRQNGFKRLDHPIHSQTVYLTPSMLERLEAMYQVKPYTIVQRPGDAIFIPAGCAHQVSNQTDAIKIACDFVSTENLQDSANVARELRAQRLHSGGDDVLQLHSTLWYAWVFLSALPRASPTPPSTAEPSLVEELDTGLEEERQTFLATQTPSSIGFQADESMEVEVPSSNMASHGAGAVRDGSSAENTDSLVSRQLNAKALRKQAYHKQKRAAAGVKPRPPKPGHDYQCPSCPRKCNRGGLLNHLRDTHKWKMDPNTERRLRKESLVVESEFWQTLRSFLVCGG